MLSNFLVRSLFTIFKEIEKKTPSEVAKKYPNRFLPYPELPKRPKQKNSWSERWLIDQLYIKLGVKS